ncbi:RES family NAD+ phosphorylase [Algoriphagus sp. Y33]|uniref:RES family NAD+ phosphorylase n=1 Tax=Algoriphagus sp. Y33 TaxID=2772483 RepID=UPI0017827CAD|nr:RES family NAD+ phosphorylase [Algoriphagus sp. Y33]
MKFCALDIFLDPSILLIGTMVSADGNCPYTSRINVPLVPLSFVGEKLENLLSLYSPADNEEEGIDLIDHILDYWPSLFDLTKIQKTILPAVFEKVFEEYEILDSNLIKSKVVFLPLFNKSIQDFELDLNSRWEKLTGELKYQNRFFLSEELDWDSIGTTLELLVRTHAKGNRYYRARISEDNIDISQMGKPPKEKASAGRANPLGISYLYLATDPETTYYESRAGLHEQIFLGEFEAMDNLNVVSLERIEFLGPVEIQELGFDLVEFIRFRGFLMKLSEELSKPIRKKDSDFDYLPTQYLCEYIKSVLGFDGVQYQSSMNPSGSNLAIFNDDKVGCISVKVFKVDQVRYEVSEREDAQG